MLHQTRDEIISFKKLRAFIGITGIILPIIVVLGSFLLGAGRYSLQPSVSHYYYSRMHIVFVSTLGVLGGFLITYQGKDKWESRLSNLAGSFAFGIAAFPTEFADFRAPDNGKNPYIVLTPKVAGHWGDVHFIFAAALFVCFTIFCLYFFQKPDNDYTEAEMVKFKKRQLIYKICGWIILISIAMIGIIKLVLHLNNGLFTYATFIFETTSLWAFGTAWLVKGSAAFKETPILRKMVSALR